VLFRSAVAELHEQPPLEDEEEFVLGLMVMPDELALDLCDPDVRVVHAREQPGRPVVLDLRELGGDVASSPRFLSVTCVDHEVDVVAHRRMLNTRVATSVPGPGRRALARSSTLRRGLAGTRVAPL